MRAERRPWVGPGVLVRSLHRSTGLFGQPAHVIGQPLPNVFDHGVFRLTRAAGFEPLEQFQVLSAVTGWIGNSVGRKTADGNAAIPDTVK